MILDGVNVSTFGVIVDDRSPSRSGPRLHHLLNAIPGAKRRLRIGQQAPNAKLITVTGAITGSSLLDLQQRIDEFKYRLRPDRELALQWSDDQQTPAREWLAWTAELRLEEIRPSWIQKATRFRLELLTPDSRARETTLQSAENNGALPRVIESPIGTAPHPLLITITGNTVSDISDPVIDYRDSADAVVKSLAFTGITLTGTDTLVIDTEAFTAESNGVSVGANLSGSYFDIDPDDGDFVAAATPDVRLSDTGGGTADLFRIQYRRRYW